MLRRRFLVCPVRSSSKLLLASAWTTILTLVALGRGSDE